MRVFKFLVLANCEDLSNLLFNYQEQHPNFYPHDKFSNQQVEEDI